MTIKCFFTFSSNSNARNLGTRSEAIGGTTLECMIWSLVDTHLSATFDLGLNQNRLQHFYMILHVKCCTLMCVNQLSNDTV